MPTTLVVAILLTCFGMTISTPPTDADCVDEIPFADTEDCTAFYQCFLVESVLRLVHLQCVTGGIWDDVEKACVQGTCEDPTTTTEQQTTTTEPTPETSETSTTSTDSGSSTLPPTSTTPAPPTFTCTSIGFFAHPTDPTKYYHCVFIGAQFYYHIFSCPPKSCFQQSVRLCLIGSCPSSNSTTAPPVQTTTAVTTAPPPFVCSRIGFFAHPDPTKFYKCVLIGGRLYSFVERCPPLACFQQSHGICLIGVCPTTTVRTTTTTPRPFVCNSDGFFAHPTDPTKYYHCVFIYYSYLYKCPPNTCFQQASGTCVLGTCPLTKAYN